MSWDGVQALLKRARTGDRDARAELCALVQDHVHGLVQKLSGRGWPQESVADLSQEILLKVFLKIGEFQGGNDDANTAALLRAWLGTVVTNEAKNYLRHKRATRRTAPPGVRRIHIGASGDSVSGPDCDPPSRDPTPSFGERLREQRARIKQAIGRLPDAKDRQMAEWFYFEDWNYHRIADELHLTYDQVRYRMVQIKDLLEAELRGDDDNPKEP